MRRLIALLRQARQPLPFLLVVLPLAIVMGLLLSDQAPVLRTLAMAGVGLYLLPAVPIVMTAIILAFDRMVSQRSDRGFLWRLLLVTVGAALLAAVLGVVCGLLWKTGSLSDSARLAVGEIVEQGSAEIRVYLRSQPSQPAAEPFLQTLLNWVVPTNLFAHLTNNETLKIIVASAAFGFSIHFIPPAMATPLRLWLSGVNAIASRLLHLMLEASPLIILLLIASAVSKVNAEVMLALINFMAAIASASLITLLLALVITRRYQRGLAAALLEPCQQDSASSALPEQGDVNSTADIFMLGISTASSITLFSSVATLLRRWRFSDQQIDTAVAINLLVARAGNILYNMVAIIFAINFYDVPLDAALLIRAIPLAILTGLATAGLSGIAVVPVVALALDSMRIPSGPVIVLLLSIDPVLSMVRAGITGVVSLSAGTLICSPVPTPAPSLQTRIP